MRLILWLDEITPEDEAQVGAKALNLAEIKRAGFVVPDGFCITVAAYEDFVAVNGLGSAIRRLLSEPELDVPHAASRLQKAMCAGHMSAAARAAIVGAYRQWMAVSGPTALGVAVRSSATTEDSPTASFAGQQATLLNVPDKDQLLRAVVECWTSLWSPRAVLYRAQLGVRQAPAMAVLVQEMVDAESAGVAFSQDPVSGEQEVVIEAAFGLGEGVVSGEGGLDRYTASRDTCLESALPAIGHKQQQRVMAPSGGLQTVKVPVDLQHARVLTADRVQQVAETVMALERQFRCPQDMEWAFAGGQLYILQSRPITTVVESFFTHVLPGDDCIWTSGFLNERFPLPVSPLGWTVISGLLEELAFRDPLRYLGVKEVEELRITKLYRGHPYVNLFVFQTLYKVFPDWLLPEDACRYFPSGRTELREAVQYPRSPLDPWFLLSMTRHFLQHPAVWSPWHNYRVWAGFAARHDQGSQELEATYEALCVENSTIQRIWTAIEAAQQLNAELLSLHRWALTCADLTYSLLRRLARSWVRHEEAMTLCTQLVTGVPNKSLEMNDALYNLAQQTEDSAAFHAALASFLAQFGHRSFYLDIYHPPFAEEPAQVLHLAQCLRSQTDKPRADYAAMHQVAQRVLHEEVGRGPLGWLKWALFDHVLCLAQRYMPLREDQRFYWQRTLALQRRLFLLLGKRMRDAGVLYGEAHVFFLTQAEIEAYVRGKAMGEGYAEMASSRQRQFDRLCQESEMSPDRAYPPFLRGNRPLQAEEHPAETRFQGRGVSPGLARGRAVIVRSPTDFSKVKRGDVLVAPAVDPGWTPVFPILSALVLEHGGQLSHAAVVAREYGLPAVVGIPRIAELLRDDDTVLVDGLNGWVSRVTD